MTVLDTVLGSEDAIICKTLSWSLYSCGWMYGGRKERAV